MWKYYPIVLYEDGALYELPSLYKTKKNGYDG